MGPEGFQIIDDDRTIVNEMKNSIAPGKYQKAMIEQIDPDEEFKCNWLLKPLKMSQDGSVLLPEFHIELNYGEKCPRLVRIK